MISATPGLSESDTRAKLIDPAIPARIEELIRREETDGAVEIIGGRPFKQGIGRIDHTLRIKVSADARSRRSSPIRSKRCGG